MTDPNREKWESEAEKAAYGQFPDDPRYEDSDRYRMIDGFAAGYISACEKYAPRWVEVATREHDALIDIGWSWTFADGDGSMVLFYPSAPPAPGGEK